MVDCSQGKTALSGCLLAWQQTKLRKPSTVVNRSTVGAVVLRIGKASQKRGWYTEGMEAHLY